MLEEGGWIGPLREEAAKRPSLRDHLESVLYGVSDALVHGLPTGAAEPVAAVAARAMVATRVKNVRWALANLHIAFPELTYAQRVRLCRESYKHFGWNAVDWVRSHRWSDRELLEHCPVEGRENLDKAMSLGRGALLLTLHLGNWEIGVQVLSAAFPEYRPAALAHPLTNRALDARFRRTRTRAGGELIDRRRNAAPRVLRALHQGRCVAMLLDQYSRRSRGVFVPLFGARCSTSAGMATIAVRTGAPVVPCFVLREGADCHRAYLLPQLSIPVIGDRKRDIEVATAHYNATLEAIIRRHPEQWMWGHRRFRHSPDLSADPYV